MSNDYPPAHPHVVIVGAGFAGLRAATTFKNQPVRVTLIDRSNHHLFQPLLYQVATATLSSTNIASPIRSILRKQRNVRVVMATVTGVDLENRKVCLDDQEIGYDYLILATGMHTSYFGNDEWATMAPGLKTIADALEIRRRVFGAFELAELEQDPAERDKLLTFVVVGGGPTGVEMAGALAEIARFTLRRDFRRIDPTAAKIYLIDGAPRLLTSFPEKLARRAQEDLERLGVEVVLNSMVSDIEPDTVDLPDRKIRAGTIIWAAGVVAHPLITGDNIELGPQRRTVIERFLNLPGYREVYVVGDLSVLKTRKGEPLPALAPVAIQQGEAAAKNILRQIEGKPRRAFRYKDRGTMATIGRDRAIADIGPLKLTGRIAWLAWVVLHILMLIGFRNRIVVMTEWIWAYITHQRSARLIIGSQPRSDP